MAEKPTVPTYVKLAESWKRQRDKEVAILEYTYNDFIVHPGKSVLEKTLDEVDLSTELVKGIPLKIPIVSANMNTVTEENMAILMARVGGIGILHRASSVDEQVSQIKAVKDAIQYVVENPSKIGPDSTVGTAREIMGETNRGYVLITDERNSLLGIATTRDVKNGAKNDTLITEVMTAKEFLITAPLGISKEEAQKIMFLNKVEKLPLIDSEGHVAALITYRDLKDIDKYPLATKDEKGRLRVGVAIGVENGSIERAEAAIDAGADVIVVDVLHGDCRQVEETVRKVKNLEKTVPVIAGNIAGADSAKRLMDFGADGIKVGYGPGGVCTTRLKTGTGMPQFSAVVESSAAVYDKKTGSKTVTINADGNIREGGDITKALAGGADHVMIGSLLAGTDESPGEKIFDDLTKETKKKYLGMASDENREALAKARGDNPKRRTAQGTSTFVPYIGSAEKVIEDLVGGITSGIANAGAKDIKQLQEVVVFGRQTYIGYLEGTPHARKDYKG